ncbi:hypothetical protein CABS01_10727 [Colletotrichum abscissum]|uniref:uncharacterized protein n=1 Tax=Colletotrichum abscissum TaxID=1671311 RepID=UPI0027D493D4|nr:uncharacterized protein CABS01_10727 [Colletotrichum abscissum]KAK1497749.1 hypothetical protein CABS01_10727 [Colletotrichum abscissum]
MPPDWAQIGLPCFPLATKRAADRLLSLGTQEAKQKQSRAGYGVHSFMSDEVSPVRHAPTVNALICILARSILIGKDSKCWAVVFIFPNQVGDGFLLGLSVQSSPGTDISDMVEQWSDCPRCSQRNLQGGSSMSKRVCTTSPRSSTTPSPTGPRGPSRIVAFFRLRSIINLRALPTVGLDFRLIQPKDVDGGEEP